MLENFSPKRKHFSVMPFIENVIWKTFIEMVIDRVKNKDNKSKS